MILDAKTALPYLRLHGRTRFPESRNALFFNWTCSGFSVRFRGTVLRACFLAMPDRLPFPQDAPEDLPMIGTVPGNSETLEGRWLLSEGENSIELFAGEAGEHTLRIVKLSETCGERPPCSLWKQTGNSCPVPLPGKT